MTLDLMLPLVAVFISVALGRRLAGVDGAGANVARPPALAAGGGRGAGRPGCSISSWRSCGRAGRRRNNCRRAPKSSTKCRGCSAAWSPPAGPIRRRPATTRSRRSPCPTILRAHCRWRCWDRQGGSPAIVAGGVGYLLPDLGPDARDTAHQKAIQNGLPDAIDLIVVCVEAGSSLDQAIVRASEELEFAHAGAGRASCAR